MAGVLAGILEIVPLSVFIFLAARVDPHMPETWKLPFVLSGSMALAGILLSVYKKRSVNRIFLGINLYLVSGGMAFITRQYWLNDLYGSFQASGMILWVIGTGIVTTVFSPRGFIGVGSGDTKKVRVFSLYLLVLAVMAFSVSFAFRGNQLLSEALPFISLFAGQAALRAKILEKEQ